MRFVASPIARLLELLELLQAQPVATGRLGLTGSPESAAAALTKLHRALPDPLARRVESLEAALDFTATSASPAPVRGETALLLAEAVRRRRRVRTGYRAYSGEHSHRELSPHGLVVHSGRWYLGAHDHSRGELRTFRVDRMRNVTLGDRAAVDPPDGFDAVAHVSASLARVPRPWEVEVLLDLGLDEAAQRLPPTLAEVVELDAGTLLRMRVDSLDWMAGVLAGLECGFTIHRPPELRVRVMALADRLAALVRPA
jgi:predicted DNA-binding transcriptional regulator YafY